MAEVVFAIKRSQDLETPPSLANGELAYSFSSGRLFIGRTANSSSPVSIAYIGGELLVNKVANIESVLFSGGGRTYTNITVSDTATIDKLVLSSFIENGVMYTNNSGEVEQVSGTVGEIMQVDSDGTPSFSIPDGGEF